jgi:Tol biopolymer transport system component
MITLDFELQVGPGAGDIYPVVARAPGGDADTTLKWSLTSAELDRQLALIEDKVLVSSVRVRRAVTEHEQPVRDLGQRLFEALITGDVYALYVASGQQAREQGCALRLVLRVRPPELVRLPWEFLFDPGQQDYLSLTLPLVRHLQVLAPRQPLRVVAPLRILGMVALPGDQHALNVEAEQQRLQDALASLQREGFVELRWVTGQTYTNLEDALEEGPWHGFHFVGHGGYDPVTQEGTIVMADDTGRTAPVGAEDISRLLAEHYPLRLVVLNACVTGRGSTSDAFSSTAAALIRRKVPAVVAMQFEITDSAAIRFAHTFYQYVAKGRSVDDSVMRARRALRRANNATLEWGTPVLYLRTHDGHIFDTTIPSPQPRSSPDPVPPSEVTETQPNITHQKDPNTPVRPALLHVSHHPKATQTLQHDKQVNGVAFSPNGRQLATASDDTVQIWSAANGVRLLNMDIGPLSKASGVAFSPNGRWLATAGADKTARIWDAANGQQLATVTHDLSVWGVAFSPDGRRLATASYDHTARIWDIESEQQLTTVTHDLAVWGVSFSPDGCRLITASADRTARVWDATSGQQLVTINHNSGVWGLMFSPDGTRVATASDDRVAQIWDAAGRRQISIIPHKSRVLGVAFSPDGTRLATASADKTARVSDAGSGDELAKVEHDGLVRGVTFSPDGHWLATASADNTARIWALSDGK